MYCINCGSKFQVPDQKYCAWCGARQSSESNSKDESQVEPNLTSEQTVTEKLITKKTKVHEETGAPYRPAMKFLYGFIGLMVGNIIFAIGFNWVNPENPNPILVILLWVWVVSGCAKFGSEIYTDQFD